MKLKLSIAIILITSWYIKRNWINKKYNEEVRQLFSEPEISTNKAFSYSQLEGLPEPVQRYFRYVLKEGQPYIKYVRLKHDGFFKTDLKQDWIRIKGEQYFITPKPGFVWIGKTTLFTARDMFLAGQGGLRVNILSLLKVAEGTGPKYDQGELLRWLGESAWFPTNLLPSENLTWSPVDENTALLTFKFNQLTVSYKVFFNATGEIIQMETKRYMGEENLENWVGKFSEYQEINGVRIPTRAEGLWRLASGDHSYANFKVKAIEYDKPELYK